MSKSKTSYKYIINFYNETYYDLAEQPILDQQSNEAITTEITQFELKAELIKFRVELSRLTRKIENTSYDVPDLSDLTNSFQTLTKKIQLLENKLENVLTNKTNEDELTALEDKYHKKFGRTIIEVLDSFDRIVRIMGKDILNTSVGTGILAIQQQLEQKLKLWHFEAIPTEGMFNPNLHMAVATDWDETKPLDCILDTHLKGYTYKGFVFRNAEVTVNRQPKS